MARNGTGIYSLPSGNPVVSGSTISVTWANNTLNDIASALTQSVSKDGQTVMTGAQNFGGFKIINLASGTTSGDAVHFGQLALKLDATGGSVSNLTVSDGTANGVTYLNASKVLTSGAALTFDGANLGVGTAGSAYSHQITSYKAGAVATYLQVANGSTGLASTNGIRLGLTSGGSGELYSPTALIAYIDNSEQMRLTSAGLGLGVVPSAWGASWKTFQASRDASFGSSNGGPVHAFIASNAYATGTDPNTPAWKYNMTGSLAARYEQLSGVHSWFTAPSGTAGGAITFTQAMTLDASGNLLVRQTSSGNLNSRGFYADSSGYFGQNHQSGDASGSVYTYFGYNGATVGTITQYGTTGISLNSSATLAFQNGAGTLDTSGNLAVTGTVTGTNLYAQSQTWQNVTGSRAIGTSYTNSTARPIEVQTSVASAGGTVNFYMNMNGTYIRVGVAVAGSSECAITVTVPPGQTYGVSTANGSMSSAGAGALAGWNELR
jgi:hypothetical protein